MNLSHRYEIDADVSFQRIENATVIVHLGTGRIHHTNETGSRIWELLEEGRSLDEIVDTLQNDFGAPGDQLRREVSAFVELLSNESMIRPAESRP